MRSYAVVVDDWLASRRCGDSQTYPTARRAPKEGRKKMSLRSEAVEAMAAAHIPFAARAPVLAAIDEYEEVEVLPCASRNEQWLRLTDQGGRLYNPLQRDTTTILRRKQKPEPDVTELARRAVEARCKWGLTSLEMSNTMDALAEAVDK